jgi:CBS domain-containing protein
MTRVSDVMTRDLRIAVPEMPIEAAARLMAELDAGALPVVGDGRLQGMVTDRDIVVRAVALGLGLDTPVADVMTPGARYCFEDDEVEAALAGMGEHQIRRMPVLDRTSTLVGILSLSDAVPEASRPVAADAIEGISAPGGEHSQADVDDPHGMVAPTTEADGVPGVLHFTDDEPS